MPSTLEEHTFERAMNDFIDNNIGDKFLVDLENPSCRLVSPRSRDSPASDKSNTLDVLNNIKTLLKDGSEFAKNLAAESRPKSLSSKSSVEGNTQNKNEILEHAEAVIEYQRERINILEKTLEKFNVAMTKTTELHKDELERFEKENKDMRMQMQNVISDYDAITKRYQVDMGEFEALKGKSLEADSELMKKDQKIKELEKKLEIYPKENEVLKMQKNDLLQEVKALKNELFPPVRSWQRNNEEETSEYGPVHSNKWLGQQKQWTKPHVLCDVRKQETAAMGRCLMQVENDLCSYKRLCEDQKSEIMRLNNLLEVKNKKDQFENNPYFGSHKQLMYLRDVFVSMVKTSNQLAENLKAKKEEPVHQEDRSLHAAYMLKSNAEQREMYDKLLNVVKNVISVKSSTTSFYRCKVEYCKLSDLNEKETRFHTILAEVEESMVLVHNLENDQIVHTEMITKQDLKAVRSDYANLQFILKDQNYHVFKFDNADAYNRLYYSLQYAGFLMDQSKLSIYSKVDLTHLNTEESWPQDLVPVLFSKVVTLNDQNNVKSPSSGFNRNKMVFGYPFNTNAVLGYQQDGQFSPGGRVMPYPTVDWVVNSLFENVNVLSEFTSSLVYYDQSSKSLVIYGPNLANKPKVVYPEKTYKFKVTNTLDYSDYQGLTEGEGGEKYVESYQVPFATFPNGQPVLQYFNPQLNNYSLVSVKYNRLNADFSPSANNLNYHNHNASPVASNEAENYDSSPGRLNLGNFGHCELEFDVYYLLPLNPKYNEMLTRLLEKLKFLKLKLPTPGEQLEETKMVTDDEKFYTFEDGYLVMTIGPSTEEPIRISCETGHFKAVEGTYEVTLMSNIDTDKMESFHLMVTNPSVHNEFLEDLLKNGFKQINEDLKSKTGELCLVTKGFIQIFNFNHSSKEPTIVFQPENCKVEVDESLRTINIINKTEDDKVTKMSLDCLNPTIFAKWKFALKFAGFLGQAEQTKFADMTTLKEFRFEIKTFEDDATERRALNVNSNKIMLYASPNSKSPFYVWERANINLELNENSRRLRIYIKKHSKNEERFDLYFPLLSDYQNVKSMLEKSNYKIDQPQTKLGLRHHYVFSRSDMIALYRTKYDKEPLLSIGTKSYESVVRTETLTIRFKPKVQTKAPIRLTFNKEPTFKKFLLALKVANFLPFTKDQVPMLYFPSIGYAFACAEAKQLFKDCRI